MAYANLSAQPPGPVAHEHIPGPKTFHEALGLEPVFLGSFFSAPPRYLEAKKGYEKMSERRKSRISKVRVGSVDVTGT